MAPCDDLRENHPRSEGRANVKALGWEVRGKERRPMKQEWKDSQGESGGK